MNAERYHELLSRTLDEEIGPDEMNELIAALRNEPRRLVDCRKHLALWELFSQQCARPRSAEAFVVSCQTRLAAELDEAQFVERTAAELGALSRPRQAPAQKVWLVLQSIVNALRSIRALAVVSGFTAVVLLAVWGLRPVSGEPALLAGAGTDVVIERGQQELAPRDGLKLLPGDRLMNRGTNEVAISYAPEKSMLRLQPGAELYLLSWQHGKRFRFRAGKLEATVARQRPLRPMMITTPNAEARVIGTHFTLTATTNHTRLNVTDGRVLLTRMSDALAVKVGAGQYAIVAGQTKLSALPVTGGIVGEYWTNLPGIYVRSLEQHPRFPDRPDKLIPLAAFEAPANWSDNYGARFRGYVHPPVTGEYTFWAAGSNQFFLFISPDDKPAGSQCVCHGRNIQPSDWDGPQRNETTQSSAAIHMEAGRKYYIEALLKASVGEDHLAVAWRGSGGQRDVIPGKFLSPFKPTKSERKR